MNVERTPHEIRLDKVRKGLARVSKAKELHAEGVSIMDISKQLGVKESTVRNYIKNGRGK